MKVFYTCCTWPWKVSYTNCTKPVKVLNNKHVLYVAYETIIYDFSCSISDLSQYYMWPNEVLNIAYESIVCLQPMKVRSIGNL